jgi:hypothetical protein
MNERIRELAEQANELDYETFDEFNHKTVRHYKFNKQKFAELIIRECAELTLDHKNDNYYNGWLDYRDEIKRHFGVDE